MQLEPVDARGEARVKLSYEQVITSDGGLCEYRYPLSTEKFSSTPLEEARVEVALEGGQEGAIGNVFSPSHPVTIERPAGGASAKAVFSARNVLPDRDFVLYFQKAAQRDRALDVSVVTHRVAGDDVSGPGMIVHAPLTAGALLLAASALGLSVFGLPATWPAVMSVAILGALATERAWAGARAAAGFDDPAGYWYAPVHLVRNAAWTAAIAVWSLRRLSGAAPSPSDSMHSRPVARE